MNKYLMRLSVGILDSFRMFSAPRSVFREYQVCPGKSIVFSWFLWCLSGAIFLSSIPSRPSYGNHYDVFIILISTMVGLIYLTVVLFVFSLSFYIIGILLRGVRNAATFWQMLRGICLSLIPLSYCMLVLGVSQAIQNSFPEDGTALEYLMLPFVAVSWISLILMIPMTIASWILSIKMFALHQDVHGYRLFFFMLASLAIFVGIFFILLLGAAANSIT
jgi:hypothetical protein